MDKLLCERPRRGSNDRASFKRSRERNDDTDSKEPIRSRLNRTKYLNENLNPLKRFLQSRVGRPWDKVYSEIREHFDKSSAVKLHIFEHLKDYVELNVVYRDGKYYEPRAYSRGSTAPEVSGFYVDRHGILRKAPSQRYRFKKEPNPNVISIEKYQKILILNGCWFIGQFKDLPAEQVRKREYKIGERVRSYEEKYTPPFTDVYLKRDGSVDAQKCVGVYGERVYCRVMRQLGKREIKFWKRTLELV